MDKILQHNLIPVLAEVDLLVVGAGSAGCCAAIAASESGSCSVALVERYGFLGGISTQVLDTFYGFFTPGDSPKKVVGGIPDRVVNVLNESKSIFLRPNTYGAGTGVTYNPERLKVVWDQLIQSAGVQLFLHTSLVDLELSRDQEVIAAVVWNKSGFFKIKAKRFIDTSGDADLCHLAGLPYEKAGELDPAQTLTTTFRICNVDLEAYKSAGGKEMLMNKMAEAVESGQHELPRKKGSIHAMPVPGCISTVAVRVSDVDPTNIQELTAAEIEGRRQAFLYEKFFRDSVPGFAEAYLIGLSHQIGVRESRRVYGEYRLTRDDCLGMARFKDKVLLCGAPIEDHRKGADGEDETAWAYIPDGNAYEVPYRTLIPQGSDQIWVAGRCFSATHDAHASCRSMAQTMSMGQAAGAAAALSIETSCGARSISIDELQDRLFQLGAVLEFPDQLAATGRDEWHKNFQEEPSKTVLINGTRR